MTKKTIVIVAGWLVCFLACELSAQKLTNRGVVKEDLRYEGLSFEEWTKKFRTELEPKSLNDALTALSTFAPHGYDKQVIALLGESLDWQLPRANHQQVTQTLVTLGGWEPLRKEIERRKPGADTVSLVTMLYRRRSLPKDFVDLIMNKYQNSTDPGTLGALCRMIARCQEVEDKHYEFLLTHTTSSDSRLRSRATEAFTSIPLSPKAYQMIQAKLPQLDQDTRANLTYNVLQGRDKGDVIEKEAEAMAMSLLNSREDQERIRACQVLGSMKKGTNEIRKTAFELLRAPDTGLQYSAFELLSKYGTNSVEVRDALTQYLLSQRNNSSHSRVFQVAAGDNPEMIATLMGELVEDTRIQIYQRMQFFGVLESLKEKAMPALPAVLRQMEASIAPPQPAATTTAGRGGFPARASGGFSRSASVRYPGTRSNPLQAGLAVLSAIGPACTKSAMPVLKRIEKVSGLPVQDRYALEKTMRRLEAK